MQMPHAGSIPTSGLRLYPQQQFPQHPGIPHSKPTASTHQCPPLQDSEGSHRTWSDPQHAQHVQHAQHAQHAQQPPVMLDHPVFPPGFGPTTAPQSTHLIAPVIRGEHPANAHTTFGLSHGTQNSDSTARLAVAAASSSATMAAARQNAGRVRGGSSRRTPLATPVIPFPVCALGLVQCDVNHAEL